MYLSEIQKTACLASININQNTADVRFASCKSNNLFIYIPRCNAILFSFILQMTEADRGFDIADILDVKDVDFHITPFLRGKNQLSEIEVLET